MMTLSCFLVYLHFDSLDSLSHIINTLIELGHKQPSKPIWTDTSTACRILNDNVIQKMKPGSIVFDLAVTQGGNSAYSEVDKVVNKNGVKIIGISNVMNKLPLTASSLFAKNVFSFVRNLYSKEKKQFILNMEDEIIKSTLIQGRN